MLTRSELPEKRSSYCRLMHIARTTLLLAVALSLLAGGASAAEKGKTKTDAVQLQAVKVTANKMEEDPLDVPQSLTIINEIELQEKGIKNVTDVINEVPGMTYVDDRGTSVNFRGLNSSMFTMTNPVTLYVDGVGHSGRSGFDASLMNVQRVEVLRGPSSTLYGKDAMGAVINIITKDPTNTWEGRVGAEFGTQEYLNGYASANGPLVEDSLYFGFGAQFQKDQGYIDNEYPGNDNDIDYERDMRVNGYLLYKPNDNLRIRFSARHSHEKRGRYHEYGMATGSTLDDFDPDDSSTVSEDVNPDITEDDDSQSLRIEYSSDATKFDSITTHKYYRFDGFYDTDLNDDPNNLGLTWFYDTKIRTVGQEFRLSSLNEEGFRWLCGVYGDMEKQEQGPFGQQYWSGAVAMEMDARTKQDTYTLATFAQAMIPLGANFELTLGGRFQRITKSFDLDMYMGSVGATSVIYNIKTTKHWNAFLPKAALTYDISDHWTTYLSYTHGYMPGGFNYMAMGGTLDDNTFNPELSKNYEIGLKAGYDDFTLGATLFYMDIEDIHVYKQTGVTYATDNAKKAHSMGVEIEGTYRPIDTLKLSGAVNLIRAKYDDYDNGTKKFDGEDIEQTPAYSIRLSAAYHAPSGFYARADGRHFGSRSFMDKNYNYTKADPYTVIDTKIGYQFNNFDIYGYVNNVLGKRYVTGFRDNSIAAIIGISAPRTLGLGVAYNF